MIKHYGESVGPEDPEDGDEFEVTARGPDKSLAASVLGAIAARVEIAAGPLPTENPRQETTEI
jgi:hypothetical protein